MRRIIRDFSSCVKRLLTSKQLNWIGPLIVFLCSPNLVFAENNELLIIENNTTHGDFSGGTHYANSFNLSENRYLFGIQIYLNNNTFFNESNPIEVIEIEIRGYNITDNVGLYHKDSSESIIKEFNITISNSDQIHNNWVSSQIDPVLLQLGRYYFYVD